MPAGESGLTGWFLDNGPNRGMPAAPGRGMPVPLPEEAAVCWSALRVSVCPMALTRVAASDRDDWALDHWVWKRSRSAPRQAARIRCTAWSVSHRTASSSRAIVSRRCPAARSAT